MRRVRVLEVLGEGSLGRCVRARDMQGSPPFALKLLERATPARRALLQREFACLRRVGHASLVRALDLDHFQLEEGASQGWAGTPLLGVALELVDGVPLTGCADFRSSCLPFADTLEALQALHEQGYVHGDFKPDNLRRRADGRGVLLDLSAAARIGSPADGLLSGTPGFVAPEVGSRSVTAATDLFAVARTLRALAAHYRVPLPPFLEDFAALAEHEDPQARPASLDPLLEWLRGPERRAPRTGFVPFFVGRDDFLHDALRAIEQALAESSARRTLCLVGGPGSGRTRALEELRWRLVERADCRILEPGDVAASLQRASGVQVTDRAGMLRALLALRETGRTTVFLADDLQSYDDDARAWLESLARELVDEPRLVLITAGAEALQAPHRVLPLHPLPRAAVEALFPRDFPASLLDHAQTRAAGSTALWVALAAQAGTMRPLRAEVDAVLDAALASQGAPPVRRAPLPLPSAEAVLSRAVTLRQQGRPERALDAVCASLRRFRDSRDALRHEAAACLLAMGRPGRAVRALQRVPPGVRGPDWWALRGEAALKDADFLGVLRLVEPLDTAGWPHSACLSLAISAASAASLLDDPGADAALARATALCTALTPHRLRYRLHSARGLHLHRRGDVTGAAEAYRRAVELVEHDGLDDLRATASYNLATTSEQLGLLGEALDAYERSARLGRLAGHRGLEARARFAMANLLAALGAGQRAAQHAQLAETRAVEAGQATLAALAAGLRAQVEGSRSAFARARLWLPAQAREGAEALEIALAEARRFGVDDRAALRRLDAWAHELGVAELQVRALLLDNDDAVRVSELEALRGSPAMPGSRLLRLEVLERLARVYVSRGAGQLAQERALEALRLAESLLVETPAALRGPLMERIVALRPVPMPQSPAASTADWPDEVARMLELQRRLTAARDVDELLGAALDTAIVLAGAERGFVVLRGDDDALQVRAARNLDETQLGARELSFSRSVVREALRDNAPLFAVRAAEAQDDDFLQRQRSVHAQKLRAVVVLPFVSERGVRGALYLDNRFVASSPSARAREVLLFVRDQIAGALDRALLLAALEAQNRELESKRRELEELLHDQQLEMERRREGERRLRALRATAGKFAHIVGGSAPMQRALALLERAASAEVTVLVEGESGTGKELFARALHDESPRRGKPFVAINCGAMPEALLEAELFGAVRGAFTGAVRDTPGLLLTAHGGTLFLDEIGEMPLAMQVKLLRVLQEREVRAVGAERARPIDVRIVAATHRDLDDEVKQGRFREDLFFRLAVLRLPVPPLRERGTDVITLAETLLDRAAHTLGLRRRALGESALRALMHHRFPGNVRELENVLTKALVLGGEGPIEAEHLGLPSLPWTRQRRAPSDLERRSMEEALEASGGNVVQAAASLGMPRATFYRKLARHGLRRKP